MDVDYVVRIFQRKNTGCFVIKYILVLACRTSKLNNNNVRFMLISSCINTFYDFVSNMVEESMLAILGGEKVQATLDQLNEDANINLAKQLEQ